MNHLLLMILILSMMLSCIRYAETISAYSEEISETFMEEYRNREGVYVYKETLQPRSTFSSSIKIFSRDGKVFYKFAEQGKGDYDRYKDVTWEIVAEIEEKAGFLQTVYSMRIIRDRVGDVIVKYEKNFDYDKRKIYYTAVDGRGNIVKKATFPIKGKTTDNETLVYFLKTFVAHRNDKKYKSFYLISSEPRLYRVNIQTIGSEVLELPLGKMKAIKLRLIPDLGLLTNFSGALIPPTFIWYREESPHIWLQYEGLETGLGSSHIVAYIISYPQVQD